MPNQPLSGEFILTPQPAPSSPTPAPVSPVTPSPSNPNPISNVLHNHTHTKPKFYSSLCQYPEGITFQNQEADEEVILLIRRDFITNVPWILSILLLGLALPLISALFPVFFPNIHVTEPFTALAVTFYYLVLFSFAVLNFAIWYFNVGLVTDKRVIDMDVANILVKETSEARLQSIADVAYTQVGGIQGIFDYGNVKVLTETYEQNLEFDRAPNPNLIRKIIGDLIVGKPNT
ncbi:MAG: hypothetical protein ACHQT7_00800 [Candidatus Levyibacteriota bacterium]